MSGDEVHEVEELEWAARVALAHGITKWRPRLWDLPENHDLKQRRDPFVLSPSDELVLPLDREKHEDAASEKRHRYRISQKPEIVRFRLLKESLEAVTKDSKASKQCAYQFKLLKGADVRGTEKIGDDGVVVLTVPQYAECVILKFEEDRGAGRVVKHRVLCRLGRLRPMHAGDASKISILGVQQRLHAMGFSPGARDGLDGPRTRAAVMSFQKVTADETKRARLGVSELKPADCRQGEKLWEALKMAYGA